MAKDQPDIVAMTGINPMRRSYKIEDIKIRGYKTGLQESLWLHFKLQSGDTFLFVNVYRSPISSEENDGALNSVMGKMCNSR